MIYGKFTVRLLLKKIELYIIGVCEMASGKINCVKEDSFVGMVMSLLENGRLG